MAAASSDHVLFLNRDGTVSAEGDKEYGRLEVGEWKDVIAVAAGEKHSVGLLKMVLWWPPVITAAVKAK